MIPHECSRYQGEKQIENAICTSIFVLLLALFACRFNKQSNDRKYFNVLCVYTRAMLKKSVYYLVKHIIHADTRMHTLYTIHFRAKHTIYTAK